MVAFYLARLDQPAWQGWRLRQLNRTFKNAIESYYQEQYLQKAWLLVDCSDFLSSRYDVLREEYHFAGVDGRMVLLKSDGIDLDRQKEVESFRRIDETVSTFPERGYNPFRLLFVPNGATDMMPMDLLFMKRTPNRYYAFDWRVYFSTLFYELEEIDRRKSEWGESTQVGLSIRLQQTELTPPEVVHRLTEAAGTLNVGLDGRLRELRRRRRFRLGSRSGQVPLGSQRVYFAIVQERFCVLDEEYVAGRLFREQVRLAERGVYLEW
ncbi:hypothetical protein ASPZODRAFT_131679 [Penicilliopsis zonata CBS 506.65]|uniref:Uncharacterized protein n=1 Tax=Penicilliopsis zonata CBS 506.65 TaxID=1073090 RepID=A0A1L9SL88_9EURO|nr:hypothetical protein ASPZODRAFT_131679 [Penicilliopsis zonata CBS 506.65]OJJ48032.1 hypothetical protein ASPZODRAFT_131679 [Penicilliopsis zonata CBS 506.65]